MSSTTTSTELTLTGLVLEQTYSIFVVAYGSEGAPVLPSARSNTACVVIGENNECAFIIAIITHVCRYSSATKQSDVNPWLHLYHGIVDATTILSQPLHCLILLSTIV